MAAVAWISVGRLSSLAARSNSTVYKLTSVISSAGVRNSGRGSTGGEAVRMRFEIFARARLLTCSRIDERCEGVKDHNLYWLDWRYRSSSVAIFETAVPTLVVGLESYFKHLGI